MSEADACSLKVKAEGSKKDLAQDMQVILYLQKVKNTDGHQPAPELLEASCYIPVLLWRYIIITSQCRVI